MQDRYKPEEPEKMLIFRMWAPLNLWWPYMAEQSGQSWIRRWG